ncbi:hypothetical protein NKDENANG_03035 [Candidatus Entotheonellaceae bacterium PAL068K]
MLVLLWGTACTGPRTIVAQPPYWSDKTEVDLELSRPQPASRFRRPRGAQLYVYDTTDLDLALPRAAPPEAERPLEPLPLRRVPATAPLPGGDR